MAASDEHTVTEILAPHASPFPAAGARFDDYELLEERGRGGMGAVYRARNLPLGRLVALKLLLPKERSTREIAERLLREARSLAQLDHHNIVTVHHVGVHEPFQYIEMQYVDGESLVERLRRGPLPVPETVRIVEQAAHALAHAHRKGIVHRDIKPGNILVTHDGVVKVVDFGLARTLAAPPRDDAPTTPVEAATVCGTPPYMAPEQWSGQSADPRIDQYALGVTCYQLLTGRPPFSGDTEVQMRQHLFEHATPPHHLNPEIPEPLSRIVGRLMEKNPADRYASCDDLVTDLRLLQRPAAVAPVQARVEAPERLPGAEVAPPGRLRLLHVPRSLAAGGGFAAVLLILHAAGALDAVELRSLDARFDWIPGRGGPAAVAVVAVDAASKQRLAPDRPLSRERHYGELIARLAEAGAPAIGVDMLFSDRAAAEEDGGLAAVSAATPSLVHSVNVSFAPGPPLSTEAPDRWSLALPADGLPEAQRLEMPVPEVAAAAVRVGHIALSVDPDGVIRRVPLLVACRGRVYPSLSLALAMTALGVARDGARLGAGSLELRPPAGAPVRIPVDEQGQMLVNFRWSSRPIEEEPLWRALQPDAGTRDARAVLVGSRLDGDSDVGALPGRPTSPLVLAHAMAVDTLLSRSFVVPSPRAIAPLLGVAFATAAALAGGLLSPLAGVVVAAVGLLLYWAAAGVAFGGQTRYWLPLATPSLGIAGGYLSGILARHWSEEREKRALAGALSRYLSPGVVRRVLSEPDGLRLGGKRKELSVLVAEVASFAEVAEGLEPEEVDEFLTAFFAAMSEVVFRHEGTLDQLTGQGVRAFFGDPEPQEDHALRAVRCALEMRGRSADVVRAWARRGRPPLQIGIGICSGYVTVGNVGSLRRMEYTVLGRNVELAAQLARAEPGRVLVSPRTRALTDTAVSYEARSRADGPPSSFEAIGSR